MILTTSDFDATPHRTRDVRTRPIRSNSTLTMKANATFDVNGTFTGSGRFKPVVTRVRDDAPSFYGESTITLDGMRVRGTILDVTGTADFDPYGTIIATGILDAATILSAEVIGYATLSGVTDLHGESDIHAKATPILVITYEDVYGTVRQAIAQGHPLPTQTTTNHHPKARVRDTTPTTRVRLPRSRR